jgi:hypothetical protein
MLTRCSYQDFKLECVVFEASVVTLKRMRGMRVEIKSSKNLNPGWDE